MPLRSNNLQDTPVLEDVTSSQAGKEITVKEWGLEAYIYIYFNVLHPASRTQVRTYPRCHIH